MSATWKAVAVAAWLVCVATRAAAQTPPTDVAQYAVLGREAVTIRRETRVTGAVGATDGTVTLAARVRVSGRVAAGTLHVGPGTHTDRVFCNFVTGPSTLPACLGFTPPLVDPALLSPVVATPGAGDLPIPAHTGTAPIAPGAYRDVRVGTGSLLQLAGGDYELQSIRLGRAARLVCVSACRLGVAGDVVLRQRAELGAASSQRAETVRVDVAGGFSARARARITATIYAPDAGIVLGSAGPDRGAYVGRTVTIGRAATVRVDSAL